MAPLNLIGKPTPLVDGPVKVTGSAEYVADIRIPGILEGKVLRSPHAHARILNIDVEKARRAPGVYAVITAADTPDQDWGVTDLKDQPILARDKVRYVGEEVAAVAAEDEAVAFEALELISIEYEPLPAVFDPEEAMSEGASLVHDVARNIADRQAVLRGDMEAALQEADVVYEETYSTPLSYQAYMEPIGSVAVPGGNGKFTLYSPLQLIFNSRDLIAGVLGIKPENLRVIQPFVGGGFGGKSNEDPNAFITMVLAMKTNRPMRVINSRAEEFQAARPRVPTRVWLRMSARKDGTFLSKESRVVADNGAYTGLAKGIMHTALYRAENLYRIQNIRSEGFLVYTNKIPTGAFRGFGNPQGTFAQESTIDALAHELGLDPAEMRLKNALQAGDISIHGWRIGSCGLKEAIQSCAQAMDWESKRRHRGNERFRCGIGMACAIHVSGNRLQLDWEGARAYVDLDAEGRVTVRSAEGDIGQGARTIAAIIAAEEFDVGLDRVHVGETTTEDTPNTLGAFASRLVLIAGHAVRNAVADAKKQLLPIAAEKLEASTDDLVWQDGAFQIRGTPGRSISLEEVCKEAVSRKGGKAIRGKGEYDPPSENYHPKTLFGNISVAYEFAAQAAEVEVDIETGHLRILRLVAADDVGRMLNPLAVHGQVEGATVQGVGFALTEEMKTEAGQVINGNFGDYALPKAETVPSVTSVAIESNDPFGPYGAKGASEAAIVPTAPAIANAIFHATGIRMTSLPISAEKMLAAIQAHHKGEVNSRTCAGFVDPR